MRGRDERPVLELGPVDVVVEPPQRGQVEQARHPEHVARVHVELADQQLQDVVGDRRGDLEPHRRAEPAAGELAFERLQQVLVAVVVDLEFGVAGHPEQVVLDDAACRRTAAPRCAAISSSSGRNRHACPGVAADEDKPRHVVGHLDAGEELRAAVRVAHHDGQVQAPARRCRGTGAPGRRRAASAPGTPARGSSRASGRARPRRGRPSARSRRRPRPAPARPSSAKHSAWRAISSALRSVIIGQLFARIDSRPRSAPAGRSAAGA